ncbi:MAG: hypothetical protein U5K69_26245 [Balneolaceae bacterium]|nr:hypothetical protein [Balneolaceae bacterium]
MKIITFTKIIFLYAIAFATISCSNPASSDEDHDEHTEPYGLELVMNGATIIEYFDGEVTGHLHVDEGGETSLITIEFLNEEREHIHAEDLDDEYSLGWNIENEDVLGVEQHDEDGKWSFHLVGKSAGESRIQFMLIHGDHADFETPAVEREGAVGNPRGSPG